MEISLEDKCPPLIYYAPNANGATVAMRIIVSGNYMRHKRLGGFILESECTLEERGVYRISSNLETCGRGMSSFTVAETTLKKDPGQQVYVGILFGEIPVRSLLGLSRLEVLERLAEDELEAVHIESTAN